MLDYPLITVRSSSGLTSVNHCGTHLLTTSSTGDLCQWDRQSGNAVSLWRTKQNLVSALPLESHGSTSYERVALQHSNGVYIFDLHSESVLEEFDISVSNFARIRLIPQNPPLLVCPSGLSDIICHDIRVPYLEKDASDGYSKNNAVKTGPENGITLSMSSDEFGSLQNIEPLPYLGSDYILSTYECGSICLFDLRNSQRPLFTSDVCKGAEAFPSLAVWRSVALVGDTKGEAHMLNVSKSAGFKLLYRRTLNDEDPGSCVAGCLRIRDDGAVTVACCWDNSIRLFETRSLSMKALCNEHKDNITDIHFHGSTGEFATCGMDGNAHVWKI
ncbi:hypothetical protein BgAZ_111030 [Babesia gibsoni]|uniref:Uncharacterized protein n=1 Tax=Babesia gibsoni TaxID=33632 RepID=A0AAD8UVC0_BABGI|nr:hypothetical protein BgAZ_111030 [Babesia gibsoni]